MPTADAKIEITTANHWFKATHDQTIIDAGMLGQTFKEYMEFLQRHCMGTTDEEVDKSDSEFTHFINFGVNSDVNKKEKELFTALKEEYERSKENIFPISYWDLKRKAQLFIAETARLSYDKLIIELSPLNTIKFKIKLDEKNLLILTHPLDHYTEREEGEIIFSFFVNKEHKVSGTSNLHILINEFNEYMFKPERNELITEVA